MTIVNKRNAAFGWAVWQVGKRVAKKRVRSALPGKAKQARGGGRVAAIASGAAALAGALLAWRRRRPGGGEPTE